MSFNNNSDVVMTEIGSCPTPIQEFYANSNIFVTGATGFLGKILLEKLLRSCGDLNTIYVLVRNKKGKTSSMRVDELFDDVIFDRLRQQFPKFRHKIVGIAGDCGLPQLGLSLQDRQMLINEVSIIFHVAATVRFDEKLKIAAAVNVRAARDVIQLSKQMAHLKAIVHVSTAYSNVPNPEIDERFYPSPVDAHKFINLTEGFNDKVLDKITPTILDKWPNTYTFTKAVAEAVVDSEGHGLPIGVFRPAIVVSTYREPIKAWINNLYGPTGVCAGAGSGLLRTLHSDPKVNANIVPVDMCVNALIASAWEISENFDKSNANPEIPVYNYVSSNDNPIDWGKFMQMAEQYGIMVPSIKAIWYYSLTLQKNYYLYFITTIFLHYLPAMLVDGALLCVGKSPKMLNVYKKVHKFTAVISYFCTRDWHFGSANVRRLIERMSDEDRAIFFCDLKQLDWDEFFRTYIRGIRTFLLQDSWDTIEEARTKWNRLYWCHQAVKIVAGYVIFRICFWILSHIFNAIFA